MTLRRVVAVLVLATATVACKNDEERVRTALVEHSDLIDPHSVQLRRIRPRSDGGWCGELNGKNRLGAYVGWVSFSITRDGSSVYIGPVIIDSKLDSLQQQMATIGCG